MSTSRWFNKLSSVEQLWKIYALSGWPGCIYESANGVAFRSTENASKTSHHSIEKSFKMVGVFVQSTKWNCGTLEILNLNSLLYGPPTKLAFTCAMVKSNAIQRHINTIEIFWDISISSRYIIWYIISNSSGNSVSLSWYHRWVHIFHNILFACISCDKSFVSPLLGKTVHSKTHCNKNKCWTAPKDACLCVLC